MSDRYIKQLDSEGCMTRWAELKRKPYLPLGNTDQPIGVQYARIK